MFTYDDEIFPHFIVLSGKKKSSCVFSSIFHYESFRRADFDEFDHIFVMDDDNYDDVTSLTKNPDHHKKVSAYIPSNSMDL